MMVHASVCERIKHFGRTLWFQYPVHAVVLTYNSAADNMRIVECKETLAEKLFHDTVQYYQFQTHEIMMRNFVDLKISNMLSRGVCRNFQEGGRNFFTLKY